MLNHQNYLIPMCLQIQNQSEGIFPSSKILVGAQSTKGQRAFCVDFGLGRHDPVPTQNTILLWVTNFRASGSALK